jgi:transposase
MQLLKRRELEALPRADLVAHTLSLQKECLRLQAAWMRRGEKLSEVRCERSRLERRLGRELERVKHLRAKLAEANRAAKRQAAPHSKGPPKAHPKKPGRHAGKDYGKPGGLKPPQHVDETIETNLSICPKCGSTDIIETDVLESYEVEIPRVQTHVTRFRNHAGTCKQCGAHVRTRHPRQMSQAVGAAGTHMGPRAAALAVQLKTGFGLSFGKIQVHFAEMFGYEITRGALCQIIKRAAQRSEPTYTALVQAARASPVIYPDETSWKVAGCLWWMWVFVSPEARCTVFSIQDGRGFEQAASILGQDYAGVLGADGWAPYRSFQEAQRQSCNQHLIRRCLKIIESSRAGEARYPHAVLRLLHAGLVFRNRLNRGHISSHGCAVGVGLLEARLQRLLSWKPTVNENRKLRNHLDREQDAIFTYLKCPGVEATNYMAEQAIRPAVVVRKMSGGNRSPVGARAHSILASIMRTCWQRELCFQQVMIPLLCSEEPLPSALLLADRSPP